ncbi:putative copper-exporting P-type ATPase A [uncultured archaeon]|nr:putative copper-exporting P-type ATPase A [uncultured archaeon]
MAEAKIKIEGMMCGHCQKSVTEAISSLKGVSGVEVNLKDKQATVTYDPKKTNTDAIKAAIVKAGYKA